MGTLKKMHYPAWNQLKKITGKQKMSKSTSQGQADMIERENNIEKFDKSSRCFNYVRP